MSLIGGPIAKILVDGYKAKLDAANASDRIAADLAIKDIEGEIEARKHAKEIRMATAGFPEMRLMTFAIALPFVAHLWFVWMDTQFDVFQRGGWLESCWERGTQVVCGVKAFPEPFNEWQGAILLSFFGIYTVGKTIQSVGTAVAMRKSR
jgi:hypothetical protein